MSDLSNLTWLTPHNIHVASFIRSAEGRKLYGLFNFSGERAYITWYIFKERGLPPLHLFDHWNEVYHDVGADHEYLVLEPYAFCLMEPVTTKN